MKEVSYLPHIKLTQLQNNSKIDLVSDFKKSKDRFQHSKSAVAILGFAIKSIHQGRTETGLLFQVVAKERHHNETQLTSALDSMLGSTIFVPSLI